MQSSCRVVQLHNTPSEHICLNRLATRLFGFGEHPDGGTKALVSGLERVVGRVDRHHRQGVFLCPDD